MTLSDGHVLSKAITRVISKGGQRTVVFSYETALNMKL
jgi:hypothetical protein